MSNVMRPLVRTALLVFLLTTLISDASAATCPTDGSGYDYSETVSGDTRTITYTACPNHAWKAINPNQAKYSGTKSIVIPAYPKIQTEGVAGVSSTAKRTMDLTAKGGVVGIFFNAAGLYSPYGGPKYGQVTGFSNAATFAEGNTFDSCGGHSSQGDDTYHFHSAPTCLLKQLGQAANTHSPQIGWASDGFPIYGPYGKDGTAMKTCTITGGSFGTDICTNEDGGYYGELSGVDSYKFRYYIQGPVCSDSCANPINDLPGADYHPHSPTGFYGCCPSGVSCSLSVTDCTGTPANGYVAGFTPAAKAKLDTFCDACYSSGQGGSSVTTGSGCSAKSEGFALATCPADGTGVNPDSPSITSAAAPLTGTAVISAALAVLAAMM
jgi:hypothetical protein